MATVALPMLALALSAFGSSSASASASRLISGSAGGASARASARATITANITASSAAPLFRFSNVHGDGMVLQMAPQRAQIWGFCPPGDAVTVTVAAAAGSQIAVVVANTSL